MVAKDRNTCSCHPAAGPTFRHNRKYSLKTVILSLWLEDNTFDMENDSQISKLAL